ncbi:polymorphic toxin-type HINT domain-containing protein [Streptomyces bohaiensis]|nr:polymorphic toxin-type HINT domain-containing protein [Streptomyces bohaiensis]
MATDPETGEARAETVTTEILGNGVRILVDVTVETDEGDREVITATGGHPFWVPELDAWTDAEELRPGQWLRTSAGTHVQITALTHHTTTATVHNLTVNNLHTYYVLAGAAPVLVHNCGGIDDDAHAALQDRHGPEIADGVDYNVQRMCPTCNSASDAADHTISGIGGNTDELARYLARQRGLGMTHVDRRKPGTTARRDESRVDSWGRGVTVVQNSYMVHAYHQSLNEFNSIFNKLR